MTDTPPEGELPYQEPFGLIEPAPMTPHSIIAALGYDPESVQPVVVTSTATVAVARDYPPALNEPEGDPSGDSV